MDMFYQQQDFFATHQTRDANWRKEQLKKLYKALQEHEEAFYSAFEQDLNKSRNEVYLTEMAIVYRELKYMMRNVKRLSRTRPVMSPLALINKLSSVRKEPRGNVLIIVPFNYPLQLAIVPLIGAIAAGNTAMIKTSELTPSVGHVLKYMLRTIFPPEFVCVCEGDATISKQLTLLPFDLIFFTGSTRVGIEIMKQAAENLTPVVLELGGKSPAIVLNDADVERTAAKIAWGKFVNSGQTCVAPDYVLVHEDLKEKLINALVKEIEAMYTNNPLNCPDYGRIINNSHADRLGNLIEAYRSSVIYGGTHVNRYVSPTLIDGDLLDEEIFGPLLPIKTFNTLDDVITTVKQHPYPLVMYVFTDGPVDPKLMQGIQSGGVVVNDTLIHLANEHLPFGGIRTSGMGNYHGRASFDTFTHERSVMKSGKSVNRIMYPPYNKWYKKIGFIRRFF